MKFFDVFRAALNARGITTAELAVLCVLAHHWSPKKGSYPSNARIARETKMNVRTARRTLTSLQAKGVLSWVRPSKEQSNRYTVHLNVLHGLGEGIMPPPATDEGEGIMPVGEGIMPPGEGAYDPHGRGCNAPRSEHIKENIKANQQPAGGGGSFLPLEVREKSNEVETFFRQELTDRNLVASRQAVTDADREAIEQMTPEEVRVAKHTIRWLTSESAWHLGKDGSKGITRWKLVWAFRPDNQALAEKWKPLRTIRHAGRGRLIPNEPAVEAGPPMTVEEQQAMAEWGTLSMAALTGGRPIPPTPDFISKKVKLSG